MNGLLFVLPLLLALMLGWREWSWRNRLQAAELRQSLKNRLFYDLCTLVALTLLLVPATHFNRNSDRPQVALAIAIDVSPSMGLKRNGLSRLDLARQEIAALLEGLPAAQIALLPFAGEASVQVPLTVDHQALRFFLRALQPGQVRAPGSAPEEALVLAHQVLAESSGERAILLISDGERTLPTPAPPVGADIPIYSLLPGDLSSRPLPDQTLAGQPASSTPDAQRLRNLARDSGGRLLTGDAGRLAVTPLLQQWGSDLKRNSLLGKTDVALLLALLLLFLRHFSWLLPKLRSTLPLLLILLLGACRADHDAVDGKALFHQAEQQPQPALASEDFIAAAGHLSGEAREAALHNACSSLVSARQLRQAIGVCEQALLTSPGAPDSAANLSLALRMLSRQPAGAAGSGSKPETSTSEQGKGLTPTLARQLVKQPQVIPFPGADIQPETVRGREIDVERNW